MAVLPIIDRQRIAAGLHRYWSRSWEPCSFLAPDLRTAVDATDAWIDANQAAYNTALPIAFRTNATLAQKTLLFCAVAIARVSIAFLRQVFGEVD